MKSLNRTILLVAMLITTGSCLVSKDKTEEECDLNHYLERYFAMCTLTREESGKELVASCLGDTALYSNRYLYQERPSHKWKEGFMGDWSKNNMPLYFLVYKEKDGDRRKKEAYAIKIISNAPGDKRKKWFGKEDSRSIKTSLDKIAKDRMAKEG